MDINNEYNNGWGSRRNYLMALLCQTMGMPLFVGLANSALSIGASGYILVYILGCIICGIPLLYMEFIIGQFTACDSIDVWKARPCVSHIGYLVVFWQVITVLYNHMVNSFLFHYLLISFESPIPYFTCGAWSTKDCNILVHNYTVNSDCLRYESLFAYCNNLHTTFPENQYWKNQIMGVRNVNGYHIAWRVCLASGLICALIYVGIFRRKHSLIWFVQFYTLLPIVGYSVLLIGSMLQKGIVVKYDDALDTDFSSFLSNFTLSQIIVQILHNLGIGSGATINLASSSSFRAPCYSNTVITTMVMCGAGTLAVCISAMMSCPYSYEYGIDPYNMLKINMSVLYEMTPRFLSQYQHKYFYLVLIYSSHSMLGTGTNTVLIWHLLEMGVSRNATIAKYPGLASFLGILFLFFVTIPLLGYNGLRVLVGLKHMSCTLAVFITAIECLVFVVWYGLDKFSEDVHFMQGIQPKSYMKFCWVASILLLSYAFCVEAYKLRITNKSIIIDVIKWYALVATVSLTVFIFILRIIVAACRKRLHEEFQLNANWGPKSELLQRSRAMFTAQAMTKEYLYRQYHLQAGIIARQRVSNCRTFQLEV